MLKGTDVIVSVSGQIVSVPRQCACCGALPDGELLVSATRTPGKRVVKTDTRTWAFPYCSACLRHVNQWHSADTIMFVGLGLVACGFLAGLCLILFHPALMLLGVAASAAGLAGVIALVLTTKNGARSLCKAECVCPARAVGYLGWNGTVQSFSFVSGQYTTAFARGNLKKLVNVSPELHRILAAD